MIDLHCHTHISDNSMSIEEVISMAHHNGVTHLAITDHDTTEGLQEAMILGERIGVNIIPGIEISAYDFKRDRRAHILGLYIEQEHEALDELCRPLIQKRQEASFQMVEAIRQEGYNISWDMVSQYAKYGTCVYKQHIMHALVDAGYTDKIYSDLYKSLFSRGEKGENPGIAYVQVEYVDVYDAIQAIRYAGGVPVLAHPDQFNSYEAIHEWVEAGLEGLEWRHPLHDHHAEEKVITLAQKYNLVTTGGSDFHGLYGGTSAVQIGSKNPGIESLQALKSRHDKILADY